MSNGSFIGLVAAGFVLMFLLSLGLNTPSGDATVDARLAALELKLEAHISNVDLDKGTPASAQAAPRHAAVEVKAAPKNGKARKVFIDLGANCGNSYRRLLMKKYIEGSDWEVFLWEANPKLVSFYLNDLAEKDKRVQIVPLAAWTENKKMQFFVHKGQEDVTDIKQFKAHKCVTKSIYQPAGASSLFDGRGTGGADDGERNAGKYKPGKPIDVDAVDFNAWFQEQGFTAEDHVLLKIDIEGAEIPLLKHMLTNGGNMACNIDHYIVEWHAWLMKGQAKKNTEQFENTFNTTVWDKCGKNIKFDPWH